MSKQRKWIILGLLAGVLVVVAVLATGLPGMRLLPGQAFRLPESQDDVTAVLANSDMTTRGFFWLRGVIAVAVIVYTIYIIISLLTKHGRKRLINDLIRLGALAAFLYMMNKRGVNLLDRFQSGALPGEMDLAAQPQEVPLAVFNSTAPGWASLALMAGVAALFVIFVAAIAWWWFMPTRRSPAGDVDSRHKLAGEAQQAVQEIEAGDEVQDVVLRAYYRMERILADERKLARPEAMTPSEFASSLSERGLPAGAVADLTRLFEAVRYGSQQLNADQQQRAVSALKAIAISNG